jgi:hypothetical protein
LAQTGDDLALAPGEAVERRLITCPSRAVRLLLGKLEQGTNWDEGTTGCDALNHSCCLQQIHARRDEAAHPDDVLAVVKAISQQYHGDMRHAVPQPPPHPS